MTVLPFPVRPAARAGTAGPSRTAAVTGTFWSPQGPAGTFTGTYRLERLLDQYGQTAAAGVFTGELVGAGGEHLGVASRRHTAAAELDTEVDAFVARVGPVDVNLLGFLVTVRRVHGRRAAGAAGAVDGSPARHRRRAARPGGVDGRGRTRRLRRCGSARSRNEVVGCSTSH